jgi:hypothetical protein
MSTEGRKDSEENSPNEVARGSIPNPFVTFASFCSNFLRLLLSSREA